MARQQREIAPGVFLDWDDATGAYRVSVAETGRAATLVLEIGGERVTHELDGQARELVRNADRRTATLKTNRHGRKVPEMAVRFRWRR